MFGSLECLSETLSDVSRVQCHRLVPQTHQGPAVHPTLRHLHRLAERSKVGPYFATFVFALLHQLKQAQSCLPETSQTSASHHFRTRRSLHHDDWPWFLKSSWRLYRRLVAKGVPGHYHSSPCYSSFVIDALILSWARSQSCYWSPQNCLSEIWCCSRYSLSQPFTWSLGSLATSTLVLK